MLHCSSRASLQITQAPSQNKPDMDKFLNIRENKCARYGAILSVCAQNCPCLEISLVDDLCLPLLARMGRDDIGKVVVYI